MREELVGADPHRFFAPVASASGAFRGWLGIFLDLPETGEEDWHEISGILSEAYSSIAPLRSPGG
ncbi:MAG: hypothetical protein ABIM89_17425 [Mycobacteriales bacterium]